MEQPILNPPNPYVGPLRVFSGSLIKVSGQVRPNPTRFAINLQTGPSMNPRDDLALHLSPNFTPPRVVRNSLISGAWGLEESWGSVNIIDPRQPFEIMILAEQDQFKIAINGTHYCEFKYRIPFSAITHLSIDGDVNISKIEISSSALPPSAPTPASMPLYPSLSPLSGYPPAAPYPSATSYPPAAPYPSTAPYPPAAPYPSASAYPGYPPAAGPNPTGSVYASGYPQGVATPYPPSGGPGPSPYGQPGYPQQQQQPGHSSSPFGNLPINGKALGAIAGLGLGAAVLSAVNPLKKVKKMMKPHKMFKYRSSSSSSGSSRSSFSSNSS